MMNRAKLQLVDLYPKLQDLQNEVLQGLSLPQKRISPKFLYDRRGSELFEKICLTPEYYPTRTEIEVLSLNRSEIADALPENAAIFEFGSGASIKTQILLEELIRVGKKPVSYVPIDISREFLQDSAANLASSFPQIRVLPVCADYLRPLHLPASLLGRAPARAGYFPGSTIGNLDPIEAEAFLSNTRRLIHKNGMLLIGVDLVKDLATLEAAYNDLAGHTAEFNLNLLQRIRSELGAELDIDGFEHHAFFNSELSRIEMHLRSLADQEIRIGAQSVRFRRNETVHTECSYKYTPESFSELASRVGFEIIRIWTDERAYFAIFLIQAHEAAEQEQGFAMTRLAA